MSFYVFSTKTGGNATVHAYIPRILATVIARVGQLRLLARNLYKRFVGVYRLDIMHKDIMSALGGTIAA
jgi:hypothetical protein